MEPDKRERLLKKLVGIVIFWGSLIAIAAGLTVDLPIAWVAWLSWLTPLGTYITAGVGTLGFYLVSGMVLLVGLALLIPQKAFQRIATSFPYRLRLERRSRNSRVGSNPIAPLVSTSLANSDSVERLREVFEYCRKAMEYAYEVHLADVCMHLSVQTNPGGHAASLVLQYVLPAYRRERQAVLEAIEKDLMSSDDFRKLKSDIVIVLSRYQELVIWLIKLGPLLHGDGFHSSNYYRELYERHRRAVEELTKIQSRRDIGDIPGSPLLGGLQTLLPPPSTPPAPDTSEEESMRGEGAERPRAREDHKELIRQWRAMLAEAEEAYQQGRNFVSVLIRNEHWSTLKARMKHEAAGRVEQAEAEPFGLADVQRRAFGVPRASIASVVEQEIARLEREWGVSGN